MTELQVSNPMERRLLAAADLVLSLAATPARLLTSKVHDGPPRRILLLRLERIGDLLMTLPALRAVRDLAPDASIDLAVGGWNASIAGLIPGLTRVLTLDASWLARGSRGDTALALARRALSWRRHGYDLAINFEGDIRSHALMALTFAPRRVGFDHAGGGPLLTDRVTFDAGRHTAANALRLVARAFNRDEASLERTYLDRADDERSALTLTSLSIERANTLLSHVSHPAVGVHVSGGREIKQWPPDRFAEVAARLIRDAGATIVLTGSPADKPLVEQVRSQLPPDRVVDVSGEIDLPDLAAVLQCLTCLVTGDTGPMHLAEAVGTPVVGIFGPSDPRRYGPHLRDSRTVRIDLPCSPCNRIRNPPRRCVGHTPDCLVGVDVDAVIDAARQVLSARARSGRPLAVTVRPI